MQSAAVKVGTKPLPLVGHGSTVDPSNHVLIRNAGSDDLIIGTDPELTATSGFGIGPGVTQDIGAVPAGITVYGIRSGAAAPAQVLTLRT